MLPDTEQPDLYVSCVEGLPVTRYGSRVLIGAERDPEDPSRIIYHPELVVKIPAPEAARYRREYSRQVADGALAVRPASDWDAQNAAHSKAEAESEAKKAERRRAREAEAKAQQE